MSSQFPHPFERFKSELVKYHKSLPMLVSGIAEKEFVENFKRQGYRTGSGVKKWKKRKKDDKKTEGRALLIKRGRLRRGFKKKPSSGVARVINDVPYAKIHNDGSTENVSVKASQRRLTRATATSTNVKSKKVTKKKIRTKGRLYQVKAFSRKNNTPARPFMITTEPLMKDIENKVLTDITQIFNQS